MEEFQDIISNIYPQLEYIWRILLASLSGGCIGMERASRHKEAGLRTHIIVAMASALAVIVSKYGFMDVVRLGLEADTTRIASNILTGIGFLGAGVIFVKGGTVKGLTTAAGIWATSMIGLAIGSGMYTVGIGTTLVLILLQIVLHRYAPGDAAVSCRVFLRVDSGNDQKIEEIKHRLEEKRIRISSIEMTRKEGFTQFEMIVSIPREDIYGELLQISIEYDEILSVSTC